MAIIDRQLPMCEMPGCIQRAITFTNNFDDVVPVDPEKKRLLGDIYSEHTAAECIKYYWNYIWVCGPHMQKLMPRYWKRARELGYFNE